MTVETRFHIDPKVIGQAVETHPKMRELRGAVERRYGVSEGRARGFAEVLLEGSVQRFGTKYLDAMVGHLTHMFEQRDLAANVLESVIGKDAMPPEQAGARLKQLYADIQSDMEAITDPGLFARKSDLQADPDIAVDVDRAFGEYEKEPPATQEAPLPTGRHVEQVEVLGEHFERMSRIRRESMARAADYAASELWNAVSSETEQGLERNIAALKRKAQDQNLSARELQALEDAVREMSLERARSQRGPGTAEGVLRAEGLKRLDPALRALVEGDRGLELLAAENPDMLAEFAKSSGAKSRSALRRYIRGRMVTHVRGLLGEFTTAFSLGDRMVFLKGPDYNVTIPGTDLVGVTRDGKVWLIDNKAMSATELDSVGSLTRNVAKNIADDSAEFTARFGLGPDPVIGDSVARLDQAMKAIAQLTQGMDKDTVGKLSTQQAIDALCKANGIERVVTNAGGRIEGLSENLRRAGILFENLNAPIAPDTPLTGMRSWFTPE